jgi:hypothetical protein
VPVLEKKNSKHRFELHSLTETKEEEEMMMMMIIRRLLDPRD